MKLHYFQHVPFEGLGCIETWAQRRQITISQTRFYNGETPPSLDTFDILVVMGGPMNIYEESEYPWLAQEKAYLRKAIDAGNKILGVCLGAQLLADVLGGPVTRNAHKEIGWFPIQLTAEGKQYAPFKALAEQETVLHWHGDTFAIPPGATLLASSQACAHQAFAYGDHVLGLQFHLELTPSSATTLSQHCADDFTPGPYVQTAATLLDQPGHFGHANGVMFGVLEGFVE